MSSPIPENQDESPIVEDKKKKKLKSPNKGGGDNDDGDGDGGTNPAGSEEEQEQQATTTTTTTRASLAVPALSDCQYTPCYCEENVYLLCQRLMADLSDKAAIFAVFITNHLKQVPIWEQKNSRGPDIPVIWDYHVICLVFPKDLSLSPLVLDMDSALPFPCPAQDYVCKAFMPHMYFRHQDFRQRFRVVEASCFLSSFASDRSHMLKADGTWMAAPPTYEPIRGDKASTPMNLPDYLDLRSQGQGKGRLMSLEELVSFVTPEADA